MEVNQNLLELYGLSPAETELTMSAYTPLNLKQNDFFLKQGKVSDKIGFVISGLLRTYRYDDQGEEVTTQFYPAGSLVISFESFNHQVPSDENIVASTDAALMVIAYDKQKELYQKIPAWNQICRDLADVKSREMIERSLQFQTLSATERYRRFCHDHPEVIKVAPLRHIASFLGIDIATLSRIRRKK